MESFNQKNWEESGFSNQWVQDNEAMSSYGVLRGLHYQRGEFAQAKLVRAILGTIYDVVVDLRPDSPTFKQSIGVELSAENKKQLYVPRGFAHGYVVLSGKAIFAYKCDNFYHKEAEAGLRYDDPALNISWPVASKDIQLSEKDKNWPSLENYMPVNL